MLTTTRTFRNSLFESRFPMILSSKLSAKTSNPKGRRSSLSIDRDLSAVLIAFNTVTPRARTFMNLPPVSTLTSGWEEKFSLIKGYQSVPCVFAGTDSHTFGVIYRVIEKNPGFIG